MKISGRERPCPTGSRHLPATSTISARNRQFRPTLDAGRSCALHQAWGREKRHFFRYPSRAGIEKFGYGVVSKITGDLGRVKAITPPSPKHLRLKCIAWVRWVHQLQHRLTVYGRRVGLSALEQGTVHYSSPREMSVTLSQAGSGTSPTSTLLVMCGTTGPAGPLSWPGAVMSQYLGRLDS